MLEGRQTKTMMRALLWSKHGRGKRAAVAVDDLTAQVEATHVQGQKEERGEGSERKR